MRNETKRILLISNSTLHGSGYLDHAEGEIQSFLGDVKRVLFVPYALFDRDAYAATAQKRFQKMGYDLTSIHAAASPVQAVKDTDAIFIGGGNTFRLLKTLYDFDLLGPIRERVAGGMPYIGSSAGSNVAAPTIKTTNDMPIVQPPSFDALGWFRFRSTRTISIRIRIQNTWVRHVKNGFDSFLKKTTRRWLVYAKVRCCVLKTERRCCAALQAHASSERDWNRLKSCPAHNSI